MERFDGIFLNDGSFHPINNIPHFQFQHIYWHVQNMGTNQFRGKITLIYIYNFGRSFQLYHKIVHPATRSNDTDITHVSIGGLHPAVHWRLSFWPVYPIRTASWLDCCSLCRQCLRVLRSGFGLRRVFRAKHRMHMYWYGSSYIFNN